MVRARICIGLCYYEFSAIVMKDLSCDYMLGQPFFEEWDLQVQPHAQTVSIGLDPDNYWGGDDNASYQVIPYRNTKRILKLLKA